VAPNKGCAAFLMHDISEFVGQIINGDCLSVLPKLPDGSIDFVLTDPPYLVDYYDRSGRSIAGDSIGDWLTPAFKQLYRVLKPGSLCISFYGWNRVDQFFAAWRAAGFTPVGHLVWPKSYSSGRGLLAYSHEQAYLLAKGNPRRPALPLPDVQQWYYTGNRLHPTQKGVRSLTPVIDAFTHQFYRAISSALTWSLIRSGRSLTSRCVPWETPRIHCQSTSCPEQVDLLGSQSIT
jgi:adenine-specific DNA-methyltransferase